MRIARRVFALFALLVWGVAPVLAQPVPGLAQAARAERESLQERRHQRDQEERLADEAAFTSKVCSTRISASIHWPSFATRGKNLNVVGYCDVALSALERICRESKQKVQGRISHLECGAGNRRRVVINGSTIQYAVSARPARDDVDFVYDRLKRGL